MSKAQLTASEDAREVLARRAVLPGRFQPVHYGHVEVIKWSLQRVEELIVVIGSAQESHTLKNPFTAGERMLMLRAVIREYRLPIDRIYLVPVPDIATNSLWVQYLRMLLPPFDAAISRNPLVVRLFEEAGVTVFKPPRYSRVEYSGTKIRELMVNGGPWERLVPPSVASLIKDFDGINRLRAVAQKD